MDLLGLSRHRGLDYHAILHPHWHDNNRSTHILTSSPLTPSSPYLSDMTYILSPPHLHWSDPTFTYFTPSLSCTFPVSVSPIPYLCLNLRAFNIAWQPLYLKWALKYNISTNNFTFNIHLHPTYFCIEFHTAYFCIEFHWIGMDSFSYFSYWVWCVGWNCNRQYILRGVFLPTAISRGKFDNIDLQIWQHQSQGYQIEGLQGIYLFIYLFSSDTLGNLSVLNLDAIIYFVPVCVYLCGSLSIFMLILLEFASMAGGRSF